MELGVVQRHLSRAQQVRGKVILVRSIAECGRAVNRLLCILVLAALRPESQQRNISMGKLFGRHFGLIQ